MEPEEIAKKYVYGNHDALTDRQEIKDMILDIENYAKEYHAEQLDLNAIGKVKQPVIRGCNQPNVDNTTTPPRR